MSLRARALIFKGVCTDNDWKYLVHECASKSGWLGSIRFDSIRSDPVLASWLTRIFGSDERDHRQLPFMGARDGRIPSDAKIPSGLEAQLVQGLAALTSAMLDQLKKR
ncbi:unnamed protein product [Acidithrix sp. C25]|nr:unnamed protein product [Acidithrix sp. C25]